MFGIQSIFLMLLLLCQVHDLWAKSLIFSQSPNYCTDQILMGKNQRITLSFPKKLKVAIPERDQQLTINLKDQLAVIALHDQIDLSQSSSISVQFVMEDDYIFSCRFYPQTEILEENIIDLIEIKKNEINPKTLSNTEKWIDQLDQEQHPDYLKKIEIKNKEWLLKKSNQALIKTHIFKPKRAQNHFIYLSLYQIVEMGDELILQLSIRNQSQPNFKVSRVVAITRTKEISLPFQIQQSEIPANGQEFRLSTLINSRLADLLEIQVCDQLKCVTIDLLLDAN